MFKSNKIVMLMFQTRKIWVRKINFIQDALCIAKNIYISNKEKY